MAIHEIDSETQDTVPGRAPVTARAQLLTVVAVIAAGVVAGLAAGLTGGWLVGVAVVGVVAAGFFAYVAVNRFEVFVIGVLVIRASLDSPRIRGASEAAPASQAASVAAVLAAIFIAAAVMWFVANRNQPRRALPRHLLFPALALMGAGLASVVNSAFPTASLIESVRVSAALLMLLVLTRLMTDSSIVSRVLIAVYASAVVPLSFAVLQLLLGGARHIGDFGRIQGTFDHPNPFGIYLTFLIVMGVALLPHVTPRLRVPLIVLLVLCGAFLFLTYTRSAWIAAVIGVVIVGALQSRRLAVLTVVVVGCMAVLVPSISSRFGDLGHTTQYSGAAANSLTWRFEYWGDLISLANSSPITGIGLKVIQFQTLAAKNAHDDFLRTYVEMGFMGLFAYIALLIGLAIVARNALRDSGPGLARGIAVGFTASLVAFIVLSTVSNIISQTVLLWYFFAFAAAANAVSTFRRQASRP